MGFIMHGFMIAVSMVLSISFVDLEDRELTYTGTADVSAVVFLDPAHFVAADDESNTLRVYRISDADKPFYMLELSGFLGADADSPEGDIEAAARVGDTIYWITSHGRNKDGKLRPSRYRFFATEIRYAGGPENKVFSSLAVKGLPCSTLIDQFLKHPAAAGLNLESAVQKDRDLSKKQRKKLAPKEEGLNIEAMTYLPESGTLLIGLRNPLFRADKKGGGQAILFELLNPKEVVEGKAAQFGRVLLWNLGERGLRGMEYDAFRKVHYVIGGAVDSETSSMLFVWDGDSDHQPRQVFEWPESKGAFTPEGIAMHPDGQAIWIFSDDGSLAVPVASPRECVDGELLKSGDCPNKFLTDDLRKTFRARIFRAERPGYVESGNLFIGLPVRGFPDPSGPGHRAAPHQSAH